MKTLFCSLFCLATLALVAQPANDKFTNRISLVASGSISVSGYNASATAETGDPTIAGKNAGKTVWWQWTAPVNNQVSINTAGSSFDTLLGVFTGTDLATLTSISENDDALPGYTSRCVFNAVLGVPYNIVVGGFNNASGAIVVNVVVPAGSCGYTNSPTSQAVGYLGGGRLFTLFTTTGCSWSATSNDPWIVITSGSSGAGNGTIIYNVAVNTGPARVGTITAGGNVFTVSQLAAPSCVYSLSPTNVNVTVSPITNTVAMSATTNCAWTATPNASWITIVSGGSGSGNGTITYVVATNSTVNARSGTITAGGQTLNVTQDGNTACAYSLSPTTAPFGASGGTSNITVSTLTTCAWTASSPVAWVTFSTTNGTGNGTVTYTVGVNAVTLPRSATLTVAGNPFVVTQAAAACSYALTSSSLSAPAIASSSTVGVTTTTGCAWTAVANVSWLTITAGTSGTGSGTVSFNVAANVNTTTRSGTLTIGGQTFTVNQAAAPCIYSVAPTSAHFTETAQSATVAVTAGAGCVWTAVSNTGFITVDSGTPGSGNGTVGYSVSANVSTSSRTGTMTIAGSTFTVTQDGTTPCAYSITPASCACAAGASSSSIAVTSNTGCAWSVTSSDPSWLTFSPASGTGNGTVTYTITANPSSIPRSATLTIAGQIFTVNQAGITCAFTIAPTSASYTFSGGSGTVTMTTAPGCNWSSTSDSTWLTITAGASGVGNGSVSYTVASTTSSATRTGRLTIGGRVLIVTQTGLACAFTISPQSATSPDTGTGGTIAVNASDISCAWTAVTNQSWLSASPVSGTGNGSVTFTAAPTSLATTRTGTITIGGQVFTVTQDGDITVPVVTLTVPTNGSTVSNTITLAATATDNISVARVDFYRDGAVLIGNDVTSPYSIPFQTTNLSNASHTFYARAFDQANNQGASTTNTVTISNTTVVSTNQWAFGYGGTLTDSGRAIATDTAGNVLVTGYFSGTANFGGTPLVSTGGKDVFVAKYSPLGAHIWSFGFGGLNDDAGLAICVDTNSNAVIVAGYFGGTINFGGTNLVSAGLTDIFIAKFSSAGSHICSARFGSTTDDQAWGIAVNGSSDIAVTGTFSGTVSFGGTNLVSFNNGGDSFIADFSTSGTNLVHQWSRNFINAGGDAGTAVSFDPSANVILTGYFVGGLNCGGTNLLGYGSFDGYVTKLNGTTGAHIWSNQLGGPTGDQSFGVACDSSGNVYIGGQYTGTCTFQTTNLVSSGSADGFVAKYNGSTGNAIWAKGINGIFAECVFGVASDGSSIVATGRFQGTSNFGGASVTSNGNQDVFSVKYNSSGTTTWVKSFGGISDDVGFGTACDSSGNVFTTGEFRGTAVFNGTTLVTAGGVDVFVMKGLP